MTITIYKCSSENNRLDKSSFLTDPLTVSATIKGDYSADAPELYLQYAGELSGYNYVSALIDGVQQYYWARFVAGIGQTVRAICRRDPFMSFSACIKSLPIIASRSAQRAADSQGAGWNAYLSDPQQPLLVPTKEDVYMLGEFSWGSMILLTVG